MVKPLLDFLFLIIAMSAIVGCASERAFIVPVDQKYLRIALEDEQISEKYNVSFAVRVEVAVSYQKLSASGLQGGMWDSKTFQIQPSVMMNNVLNTIVETQSTEKPSLTMKLKLINYDYDRLEYGLGTSQPAVWLAIEASLFDQGGLVYERTYVSRAQCGPPFSTGFSWQGGSEARVAYAIATYKALIIGIEQAVHQKPQPLDRLRDRGCIDYGGDESWDLHYLTYRE
jgi:hypothetical protein